jgi:hypothetical protein
VSGWCLMIYNRNVIRHKTQRQDSSKPSESLLGIRKDDFLSLLWFKNVNIKFCIEFTTLRPALPLDLGIGSDGVLRQLDLWDGGTQALAISTVKVQAQQSISTDLI